MLNLSLKALLSYVVGDQLRWCGGQEGPPRQWLTRRGVARRLVLLQSIGPDDSLSETDFPPVQDDADE